MTNSSGMFGRSRLAPSAWMPPFVRQRVNHARLPGRYFRPSICIRITAESDCALEVLPSEFRSQKSVVFAISAEGQIYRSSGRGDVPFDAF